MRYYLWQNKDWQNFPPPNKELVIPLAKARFLQGQLLTKIAALDLHLLTETQNELIVAETMETSKIEGVELNPESVRSSVAERLGLPQGVGIRKDRSVNGLVDILLDAVHKYNQPLTMSRLNGWHAALFPTGFSGLKKIKAGLLRQGDIQVVSGHLGREKVHFEAPPSKQAKEDLAIFLKWFNQSFAHEDGLLRAAAAHLKFVTIHPYDDGNGRLARVITDMAMAQDEKTSFRSYSFSAQIMRERKDYYQILEAVQKGSKTLSYWYSWFINMFSNALQNSQEIIASVFRKAEFWNIYKDIHLNERQRKVVQKMLEIGVFEGGLTTRKYVAMTKTSTPTAAREIAYLYKKNILRQYGQGRSVRYDLNLP